MMTNIKNKLTRAARPLSIVNRQLSIIAAALLLFAACTNDADPGPQPRLKTVTATLPQNTGTRVGMEYDDTEGATQMKVTWSASETITIDGQPYTGTSTDGGQTATFQVPEDIHAGSVITYGTHTTTQAQTADDNLGHLPGVHAMTGTYNEYDNTITFAHDVSVLRIALSGLKASATLSTLTVGNNTGSHTLSLAGCTTTAQSTFTAWLSMKGGTDIGNLEFKIVYGVNDEQAYTHPFAEGTPLPSGQLLHCNINMETKVGLVVDAETGAIWGVPQHVVPPGYDHVVYDQASFLAMPVDPGKKIIQVADITLNTALSSQFEGIYNGYGYTITGSSGYAFEELLEASIANVHLRGMALANTGGAAKISHCSVVGSILVISSDYDYFTLCSTDQDKLVGSGEYSSFIACWYDSAPQGKIGVGYVWNEAIKSTVLIATAYLFNLDGSIKWDYKYVPTP